MSKTGQIQIGNTLVGHQKPVYIIAEAGVNHNGSLEMAFDLIREAKKCGATCVKFQTYKTEDIITTSAPKAQYQLKVTDKEESQFDMLKKLELPKEAYPQLVKLCKELDIQFMSTPYNKGDADFLEELGVDVFKIASGQLVELSFLEYVAKKGKPMIISSGMATLADVYEGVQAIRNAGNDQIILLQCTTNYPSKLEDANIHAMSSMRDALDVLVGYSDHVERNFACYAAVALGGCVIEKHFTLDRTLPGPDHAASLSPEEFSQLVQGIQDIEAALGSPVKTPTQAEVDNTQGMRRSLVILHDLPQGTLLEESHLGFKRPATGIAPKMLETIIGKKLSQDVAADTILTPDLISW